MSIFGEEFDARKKGDAEVSLYWYSALALVNVWANYQSKKKLLINAMHPETYHMVRHVIVERYGGSLDRLNEHKMELSFNVDTEVRKFKDVCSLFGVESVSREWLYRYLKDSKDYDRIRGKIKRRINKPVQPLNELV